MAQEFDLDAFIAGINSDKSAKRDSKDRLNKMLMQVKDHQGTATIIPIMSHDGQFYKKMSRVYECKAETSLLESGEAWYKILPLDYYGELTEEQLELYNEVKGYMDVMNKNGYTDRDWFRVRNYSIFYGILDSLTPLNKDSKYDNDESAGLAYLFIYPAHNVIDAFASAVNLKIDAMKGRKDWIPYVLSPSRTNRKGVMQISFQSGKVGYDASVAFEFNSDMNTVIDPDFEIPEETVSLYDNVIPTFLGWMYDHDNNNTFNTIAFKELRDQLKKWVTDMYNELNGTPTEPQPKDSSATYENKNSLNDKPKNTPF